MIRYTKKELKFLDKLIIKTFDGNHVTCSHGCACREEAIRRMVRTLIMVDAELNNIAVLREATKLREKIKQSLEEE